MTEAFKKRWLVVALAVLAVGVLILTKSCRSVPARSIVLRSQDAVETVLATGRVVGEKTIPLSLLRPGRIEEELIKDGDQVKAGQVLMRQEHMQEETAVAQKRTALAMARLNLEKLQTVDLRDAQQRVRQARANALYADDYLKRQTELFNQHAVPQLQYDQARRDKDLADSTLDAAQNQLQAVQGAQKTLLELQVAQAENDLRKTETDLHDTALRAPADGRIVEHIAHPGEFVTGGQRVITFIPAAPRTYVEIQVDEANVGKLRLGQAATISSPAFAGKVYPAAVERIGSIVDTQRGTFAVRLMMDKLESELLAESSVSVQIVTGEAKGVLLLEQRFIVREGEASFVFVAEGGRAGRRPVVVRDLGNGNFSVESGLRAGDVVLLPEGLKDGIKVKIATRPG